VGFVIIAPRGIVGLVQEWQRPKKKIKGPDKP
jgi:hypothetical protein